MITEFRLVNELTTPIAGSDEKMPELIGGIRFGSLVIKAYDNGELVTNYQAYPNTICQHKDEIVEMLSQTTIEEEIPHTDRYGDNLSDFMKRYGVYAAQKLKGAVLVPAIHSMNLFDSKDNYPITFNTTNNRIYTTNAVYFNCDNYEFNYNKKQVHYYKRTSNGKTFTYKITWNTINKDGIAIVNEAKKLYNYDLISRNEYRHRTSELYIDEFYSSWNMKVGISNIVSAAKYFGDLIPLAGKRTFDGGTTSEGAPWNNPRSYWDAEPIQVHISKAYAKMIPDIFRGIKHINYILDGNEPYPVNMQCYIRTNKTYTSKYGTKCYQYINLSDLAQAKGIAYYPEFISNKKGYFFGEFKLNNTDYASTIIDNTINIAEERCRDPQTEFAWVSTGKSYLRKLIGITNNDKIKPIDEYMLIWSKIYSTDTELSVSKDTVDYIVSVRRYLKQLAHKLGVKYNNNAYFYARIVEPRTSISADAYTDNDSDKYSEYSEYYNSDDESDTLDTKKFDTSYYDWDPFEVIQELHKANIKCDLGIKLSDIHCKEINPLCKMWIKKHAIQNNLIKIKLN